MLMNTSLVFFKEILEMTSVMGLLLVLSQQLNVNKRWLFIALGLGALGALAYALNLRAISDLFYYRGQELTNSCLLTGTCLCLWGIGWFQGTICKPGHSKAIYWLMALAVGCSVTLEGTELFVYGYGQSFRPHSLSSLLLGGLIGTAIAASLMVILYYLLVYRINAATRRLTHCLLALTIASTLDEVCQLLIQSNLISGGPAIWNTSQLLSEQSLVGRLLYALIGYEATPSLAQVSCYILALLISLALFMRKSPSQVTT